MLFSVSILLAAVGCCCVIVVSGRRESAAVPIEKIYPYFIGGPSGIMVRRENLRPVDGFAVQPFERPNENRNHYWSRKNGDHVVLLVLHYTADFDFETTVKHFTDDSVNRTSAHYVIAKPTEAGEHNRLLRVVPENCIAFHAGISKWGNYVNVNPISIGIEVVNTGLTKHSWESFTKEQIHIAGLMLARMVHQYKILPHNVVGHADVAPNRKIDPGVMFPWAKLYEEYGVGAWLDDNEMDEESIVAKYKPAKRCPHAPNRELFLEYLRAYGYDTANEITVIKAFKAHFTANQRPEKLNETVTRVDMFWIWALVAKYTHGHV